MGAWDTGLFDDDSALNILDELIEMDNPFEFMKESIDLALEEDYLDYDDCFSVIVTAALIDSNVNLTEYDILIEEYRTLLNTLKNENLETLKENCVKALKRIIVNSELNDLWEENEEEYPIWQANIYGLIERLS